MRCPVCSLENPPSALSCDCGHAFSALASQNVGGDQAVSRNQELIRIARSQMHLSLALVVILMGFGVFMVLWGTEILSAIKENTQQLRHNIESTPRK